MCDENNEIESKYGLTLSEGSMHEKYAVARQKRIPY